MKKATLTLLMSVTFLYFACANEQSMETNVTEIWKDVVGYEGLYQVSNIGQVRSLPRNRTITKTRILRQSLGKGYFKVNLSKDNIQKEGKVHRLMGFAFMMDTYFEGAQINHLNGIKTDNRIPNFKWVCASENTQHAWDIGLCKSARYWLGKTGESNRASKPISQFDRNGNLIKDHVSATFASRDTGISRQHISQCCSGSRKIAGNFIWKHK